ncbi:MAG: flagellar hook-basal body protein [Thermacetogeniaceae bacterium]
MVRGLYTAAKGMMVAQVNVDVASQNMANVNTPGYRKDDTLVSAFPSMLLARLDGNGTATIGQTATGSALDGIYTSFEEGAVHETGDPLNMAVSGNAFFTVKGPQGQLFFTRNGDFQLNLNKQLITSTGDSVVGDLNGQAEEIFAPDGKLSVASDGTLSGATDSQGRAIAKLYLTAKPAGATWLKAGSSLFSGSSASPAPGYAVRQGASEDSNVNAVAEMVKMLDSMRAYEANAKVIQVTDSTLEKAVSSIGNV